MYAIEKDPGVLACAKHNAEVYGVRDQISWYEGDCFEIIRHELAEMGEYGVVFASPPWGGRFAPSYGSCLLIRDSKGPGYRTDSVFDLSKMQPYSLTDLLIPFQQLTSNVALYLPRTSDLRLLVKCYDGDQKLLVTHYCMEGASKVRRTQPQSIGRPTD